MVDHKTNNMMSNVMDQYKHEIIRIVMILVLMLTAPSPIAYITWPLAAMILITICFNVA